MKQLIFAIFLYLLVLPVVAQTDDEAGLPRKYEKDFKAESIPADLKQEGYILLVRSPFDKKQEKKNAAIQSIFEKGYNGKFVVVASGDEDFLTKYADKKIYRYQVSAFETSELKNVIQSDGGNKKRSFRYYQLNITDALALNKNKVDPRKIKEELKKEGIDKPTVEDIKKKMEEKGFDPTAIKFTGVEDYIERLERMLTYLVTKLNAAE